MLTAEQPHTKRIVRWNKEQAAAAAAKSLDVRRKNSAKRKEVKAEAAALFKAISTADPITDVERALALAAKRGHAKACEHLSLALARLKGASRLKPDPACGTYTPTNSISQRQPTPSAPQVTQDAHVQVQPPGSSFAQYKLSSKESLLSGTVGAGGEGGGLTGGVASGVIDPITRGPDSGSGVTHGPNSPSGTSPVLPGQSLSVEQEIAMLEQRLIMLRSMRSGESGIKATKVAHEAGGHLKGGMEDLVKPKVGVAPVDPHEGMEKFLVGGTWVWGKRKK